MRCIYRLKCDLKLMVIDFLSKTTALPLVNVRCLNVICPQITANEHCMVVIF